MTLPPVTTTGTAACSAHATLFPRRPDELAALRLGRDLGKVLEVLANPTTNQGDDDDDRE